MEMKGEHIKDKDGWKEEFMIEIEEKGNKIYDTSVLKIESERFKLIGFPFYIGKDSKDKYLEKLEKID